MLRLDYTFYCSRYRKAGNGFRDHRCRDDLAVGHSVRHSSFFFLHQSVPSEQERDLSREFKHSRNKTIIFIATSFRDPNDVVIVILPLCNSFAPIISLRRTGKIVSQTRNISFPLCSRPGKKFLNLTRVFEGMLSIPGGIRPEIS